MDTLMALRHVCEQDPWCCRSATRRWRRYRANPMPSDHRLAQGHAGQDPMGARHAGRHGPIALVDEGELVVFIMPLERGRDVLHAKVRSGIEEVKSRGAFIIAVAEQRPG